MLKRALTIRMRLVLAKLENNAKRPMVSNSVTEECERVIPFTSMLQMIMSMTCMEKKQQDSFFSSKVNLFCQRKQSSKDQITCLMATIIALIIAATLVLSSARSTISSTVLSGSSRDQNTANFVCLIPLRMNEYPVVQMVGTLERKKVQIVGDDDLQILFHI